MNKLTSLAGFAGLFTALSAGAAADNAPQFIDPMPGQAIVIENMSHNGKWAVANKKADFNGSIDPVGAYLFDFSDFSFVKEINHESGLASACGVTDDGSLIAGSADNIPAIWTRATGEWTQLPLPKGYSAGTLYDMTPDGRYACGQMSKSTDGFTFYPVVYDITAKTIVELTNIPYFDMSGDNHNDGIGMDQNRLVCISPDGRYVVGVIAVSDPGSELSYVYDIQNQSYKLLGYRTPANYGPGVSKNDFRPYVDGLWKTDGFGHTMSNNGRYVAGCAYFVEDDGSAFGNEYECVYRYDIQNDEFIVYNGADERDMSAFSISNEGVPFAVAPATSPASTAYVRSGNYFISFDQIYTQIYGVDFNELTGHQVSGKPIAVSDDGLTMLMLPSTSETYVLKLKEPITEAAARVDLLGEWKASPENGSRFSKLRTVDLTFARNISTLMDASDIKLLDEEGKEVRSALLFQADAKVVSIGFRATTLEPGKTYTIRIPAGAISMQGDRNVTNRQIDITYTGRSEGAVSMVSSYPADGATLALLDQRTSPILISFDANITATENAKAALYRVADGAYTEMCDLIIATSQYQAMLYPATGQNLHKGQKYLVKVEAGSFTDVSGEGASEEIRINLEGAFVRDPGDQRYIFNEDCSNYDNWLFYEGDHLNPSAVPASWDFDADNTPWKVVSDEGSSDMAFGSHSMYFPAGQSDDWVSTVQLSIPEGECTLSFDSQSFYSDKEDRLKVIVLPSEEIFSSLNKNIVDRFKKDGIVIYDEIEKPGASQDMLAGDWKHNVISLEQFAGKDIYIAFVNENNDQSAIFIDNIKVERELKYVLELTSASAVVNKDTHEVSGMITMVSDMANYNNVELTLRDGAGLEVSKISDAKNLKKGDIYSFTFPEKLNIVKGEINGYRIDVRLDNEEYYENLTVKNRTFLPEQKVVLEEFTGRDCANCPLGIQAIGNLESIYHDRFIPITLRCYGSDPLGAGLAPYAAYLNLTAAPSGVINRGEISSPMLSADGDYMFSGKGIQLTEGGEAKLWFDLVAEEMEKGTDIGIIATPSYNKGDKTFTVSCEVTSSLNLTSQNINVFGVLVEDKVNAGYQMNNVYNYEDPDLGEWGKGGIYGSSRVRDYITNDVARTCYGQTFAGTSGVIPADLTAGESHKFGFELDIPETVENTGNCRVIMMLIDAATGRIINADRRYLDMSGVEDAEAATLRISATGGILTVTGEGNVSAEVYTLAGSKVAAGSADGALSLEVPQGIAIVKAADANGTKTAKIVVR